MIEYKDVPHERTYYVVFDKRRGAFRFWNLFTRKSFDHIYLMTELNGSTLVINPMPPGCKVDEWPCSVDQAVKFLSKESTAILRWPVKYKSLNHFKVYSIMSCVSHCSYLLGVGGFFIVSPLHLFKKLKKLGAQEIYHNGSS